MIGFFSLSYILAGLLSIFSCRNYKEEDSLADNLPLILINNDTKNNIKINNNNDL